MSDLTIDQAYQAMIRNEAGLLSRDHKQLKELVKHFGIVVKGVKGNPSKEYLRSLLLAHGQELDEAALNPIEPQDEEMDQDSAEEREEGQDEEREREEWSLIDVDTSLVAPESDSTPQLAVVEPELEMSFSSMDNDDDDDSLSLDEGGIRLVKSSSSPARDTASLLRPIAPIPRGTTAIATLAGCDSDSDSDSPPLTPKPFVFGASSAPFSFTLPSAGTTPSAAEFVLQEMQKRVEEARANGLGASATFEGADGESSGDTLRASDKGKGKAGGFEGKHKRDFDKMDSISSHYAAKRDLSRAPSHHNLKAMASNSNLRANPTLSRSLSQNLSQSATSARPAKKLKPSTTSNVVRALKDEGWAESTTHVSMKAALGTSASSKNPAWGSMTASKKEGMKVGESEASRLGASGLRFEKSLPPKPEEPDQQAKKSKDETKRKLELARARRRSSAAVGGAGNRRRSTQVGRAPIQQTNAASRFLKTTFQKFGTSSISTSATSAPAVRPAATLKTKVTAGSSSIARPPRPLERPAVDSKSKKPGWAKFDLKASLSRPLGYTPRLGPTTKPVAAIVPTSGSRMPTSLSSRPTTVAPPILRRTSSTLAAKPSLTRSSSSNSNLAGLTAPPANLKRSPSLSARVANEGMLDAVRAAESHVAAYKIMDKAHPVPVEEEEEEIDEMEVVDEQAGTNRGKDFLTAPAESLPAFPLAPPVTAIAPTLPASPSTPFRPVLTSPGPSALSPSRTMNFAATATSPHPSQIGKSKVAAGSKKVVSSATKASRDGGKAKARMEIGLKSHARTVVAKKGVSMK